MSKKIRWADGFKALFLEKFKINLLFLIVLVMLSMYVGYKLHSFNPDEECAVTECSPCVCTPCPERECPEKECPDCVCPAQKECEPEEKIVETQVIRIRCPSGDLIDEDEKCKVNFPDVTSEFSDTVDGVTLSIDGVEYKAEGSLFRITGFSYTIINKGDLPIVPALYIKVYDRWTREVDEGLANKIVRPGKLVDVNNYLQDYESVNILVEEETYTFRILLKNALTTPEKDLLAVAKQIDE